MKKILITFISAYTILAVLALLAGHRDTSLGGFVVITALVVAAVGLVAAGGALFGIWQVSDFLGSKNPERLAILGLFYAAGDLIRVSYGAQGPGAAMIIVGFILTMAAIVDATKEPLPRRFHRQ